MPLLFACALAVAVDGDTLRCANVAQAEGRVRLARIDAPERGAPGSAEATEALAAMIAAGRAQGHEVLCRQVDATSDTRTAPPRPDRYGRIVARCRVGQRGQDLGGRLVRGGFAERWG